jgi:hypothetical protein
MNVASTHDQAKQQAINHLTTLIALNNALNKPEQQHAVSLFDADVAPTDLAAVFALMEQNGYFIGTPVRVYPTRRRFYADWHVPIVHGRIEFVLSFLVAEDVA